MICSPCTTVKSLPDCFDKIIIGLTNDALTDYRVYFKDLTTKRVEVLEGTSNSGRELKITNTLSFAENHSYEMWVTKKSAASQEEKEDILIDSLTDKKNCFAVRFESAFKDAVKIPYGTVTVKAA